MKRVWLSVLLVFLAFSTVSAGAPSAELKMGTGKSSGIYTSIVGPQLNKQMPHNLPLSIVNTGGSRENLEKLQAGEIQVAVMQFDVLLAHPEADVMVLGFVYPEYVHLIVNKDSKIKDLSDLNEQTKIAIGDEYAGTGVTWAAFKKAVPSLSKIPTTPDGGVFALSELQNRQIDAVLFVGGLGIGDAKRADINSQFKMISINDSDLLRATYKGKRIYHKDVVDKKVYPNLMDHYFFDQSVVACDAVIVVSSAWAKEHQSDFEKVYDSVQRAIPNIRLAIQERNHNK